MLAHPLNADGFDPASEGDAAERRRADLVRTPVAVRARLLREDLPELDIILRNLSAAGFMAECMAPLEPGTRIVLAVPGVGYIPAEIRWNVSFRIGGLFQFELSARELGLAAVPERDSG
jgi:hypothetical protein